MMASFVRTTIIFTISLSYGKCTSSKEISPKVTRARVSIKSLKAKQL